MRLGIVGFGKHLKDTFPPLLLVTCQNQCK
uniref:Uncharacterized protein n=1 Tax=Musa acuminata subsp. malaccensis TaxID=214687 RepID=A0A804L0G1_MUSAM